MKTIKNFTLPVAPGKHQISMPDGAQIVSVSVLNGRPTIHARVKDDNENVARVFEVYESGAEVNEYDLHFIGTVVFGGDHGDGRALHIFENK